MYNRYRWGIKRVQRRVLMLLGKWNPEMGRANSKQFNAEIAAYWRKQGARVGENAKIFGTIDGVNPQLVSLGRNSVLGAQAALLTHGATTGGIPCTVGDNCYVGFGAIVLPGVTIGNNCIVGAGAVVTKDVPPNSIVAGNPARILRERDAVELANYIKAMEEGRAIGEYDSSK